MGTVNAAKPTMAEMGGVGRAGGTGRVGGEFVVQGRGFYAGALAAR